MGIRAPVPVLSRWLAVLMILSILLIGLSVLVPIPAVAQSGAYGFASAVPCLNGDLSLATTCFADTMYKPVAANDPALVRVTISSTKQMLAPIGTTSGGYRQRMAVNSGIGSVYGLAYDDGAVSSIRRLFAGAFTRRFTSFGPLGSGGVYEYRFDNGQWRPSFTVPNAGSDRLSNDPNDTAILDAVGKTGLGDMEISPDSTTLYIVNLHTRQLERYDITKETPQRLVPVAIPLHLISQHSQTLTNLRPFALEFVPNTDSIDSSPRLLVGITDTATPQVFVLEWKIISGSWQIILHQPLVNEVFNDRFSGSTYFGALKSMSRNGTVVGWNAWNETLNKLNIHMHSKTIFHAQPFLTDIEFSPDGQFMRLGLRDRVGDLAFFGEPPQGHYTAISQGDTLNYRFNSGGWILQLSATSRLDQVHIRDSSRRLSANQADWVNDHLHGYPENDDPAHVENHMGSLLAIPNPDGTETIVATSLLGDNASGLMLYTSNQPHPFRAITLIPSGSNKAAALGDLELLCTYAFISGQLWHDLNGNGIREAGEPPLGGIQLEVLDPGQSVPLGHVVTATDGSYTVAVPPNRALHVRVTPNQFLSGQPLAGMTYSPQRAGPSTLDSDAHPVFGVVEFAGRHAGNGVTGNALMMPVRSERVQHVDIGLTRQFRPATIGDRVWHDLNRNGIQDANEPGLAGVMIRLEHLPGSSPAVHSYPRTTSSDAQGRYTFTNLEPGQYRLFVTLPEGYTFAPAGRGGNARLDSDIDERSGFSQAIAVNHGATQTDIDVGLMALQAAMDLSVELNAPAEVVVGNELHYTIFYRHTGQVAATNVVLQMTLPGGAKLISASMPVQQQGSTLIWQIGQLNPNSNGRIEVRASSPAMIGGSLLHTLVTAATISSRPSDSNITNNNSVQITLLTRAEVSIVKTAPAIVLSGDTILYTLRVANRGSATASQVTIADRLPDQVDFVSLLQAPAGACRYAGAERTLRCVMSSLEPQQEAIISFQARPRPDAASRLDNWATVTTTTAGDSPTDNSAMASTAYLRPNPAIRLTFVPDPAAAGESVQLLIGYQNHGSGVARQTTLTVLLPASVTLSTPPNGCQQQGNQLLCALGDLVPAASGELRLDMEVPATPTIDQLSVQASISTITPERIVDQQDNQASATVAVVRPNPFVLLRAPTSIVGQGSVFAYTIDYGNLYRRRPAQTRSAANTVLEFELPSDVQLVGASRTPTTQQGRLLRWDLGTLAGQTAARIEVVVQTRVPAGTVLLATARISTLTPADDPVDNLASLNIDVVPPPDTIGTTTGDLRVAIRSTLDPAAQDGSQTNGVYLSAGSAIAWPTGEVLDLTPQLTNLQFSDEPLPWPYAYQVRVVGWSLTEVEMDGQRFDPRAADSRGITGCRLGARPLLTPKLLSGCVYRYLGGESREQLSAATIRERDLDDQVHLYWSRPPIPPMRSDVYLYATDQINRARLTIQVELEVQIINQAPGSIGGVPLPPIPVAPLPDPARQIVSEQIDITLLAPRSLVGPGS